MKETIKAKNAPAAIGPYSHAVMTVNSLVEIEVIAAI